MPITVPPVKAMRRALFIPSVAAKAVFPFAFVAIRMPRNPARALQSAPKAKETAEAAPILNQRSAATITTKGASQRYSRKRNAMAPFWMMPDNSSTRAFVTGNAVIFPMEMTA
jgi:hypothetical protein